MKKRRIFFLLYKSGKMDRLAYNRCRNMVTKEIKSARITYFDRKFSEFRGNMRKTWSVINNILKPGSSVKSFPSSLIVRDILMENPVSIADKLNDYFCSIGSGISDSFFLPD